MIYCRLSCAELISSNGKLCNDQEHQNYQDGSVLEAKSSSEVSPKWRRFLSVWRYSIILPGLDFDHYRYIK